MHMQGENRPDSASRDILCNVTGVCKLQPLLFCIWEGLESHLFNNSTHRASLNCLCFISQFLPQCAAMEMNTTDTNLTPAWDCSSAR